MIKRIIGGQIRHALGATGAGFYVYLMDKGVEPTDIEAIISGIVAILSAAWSAYEKIKGEKKK